MMDMKYKFKGMLTGFGLAFYAAMPAIADDIEIYTSGALGMPTILPNIMFVVDTSTSMSTLLDVPSSYDYLTIYSGGSCDVNSIYYTTDGTIPSCGSSNKNFFDASANKCDNSLHLYDAGVVIDPVGPLLKYGQFTDQLAQRSVSGSNSSWKTIVTKFSADKSKFIECKADSGLHGETSATKPYIENNSSGGWTSTVPADLNNPHLVWNGGANNYTLFHGNFLNYLQSSGGTVKVSRLDVVKTAVQTLVDSNNNFNLGLMVFDSKYGQWEGGSVQFPNLPTTLTRNDFKSRLANLKAEGSTPLSEVYYEALLYYGGKAIVYGDEANPSNQTGTKENGNPKFYETPITETCQKNYIVFLSDGAPQQDYISQDKFAVLPGTIAHTPGTLAGSCNTDADPGKTQFSLSYFNKNAATSATSTNDNCLDELAYWAKNNDVATRSFAAHDGLQTITTYTVGFDFDMSDPDLVAAETLMRDTAMAGGGGFFVADDQTSLNQAFSRIVAEILKVNSTFSSPAVSVNAFNRATNLDDLFFTLFKPADGEHWEGNLKKFKLEFASGVPFVADAKHNPAIDPFTGFFKDTSVSYWTAVADAPDGAETAIGGAASNILTPSASPARKVFTFAGSYSGTTGVLTPNTIDLTSATNELANSNAAVTDTMLGIAGYLPFINAVPYRQSLLDWATGIDVFDVDADGSITDARRAMGDPLHAEPALVQYGELTGAVPDLVAYVATNDGYLHAFNTITGAEHFAFVPQESLPKLKNIFENTGVNGKAYGLDGNVVSWISDANRDGTISGAGEHAYLYFGMRRGGRYIYSMDVTNRDAPKLRWVIEGGTGDYAELGDTWSAPNVQKIKTGPGANDYKVVLIFGAGYDVNQDNLITRGTDTVGRGIYIVDASTGKMLWRAGPDGTADLQLTNMKYSIPGRIKPLDVDGDGYVDRLLAGDMGGQLWRIDIDNDANTASTLAITGDRIADLALDASVTENRRFYNPPDAAIIIQQGQAPYVAIIAASGYRAHPLQTDTHDRVYMIRDYDVYNAPSTYVTLTEADLFDTTQNAIGSTNVAVSGPAKTSLNGADGWYITLQELDNSFVGEKALSEPLILGGVAIFTTYIPAAAGLSSNSCTSNDGTGAIYFVNVVDGTPTRDNDNDGEQTRADRRILLARGGIPPTPRVIITKDGIPTLCVGTECSKASDVGTVQKMYWYEVE